MIDRFTGPYAFLSNFFPAPVAYDGVTYPTTEHAFQAAKTLDRSTRAAIQACARPAEAKHLGRACTLRPHWNTLRLDVMRSLIQQKFAAGTTLAQQLLDTDSRPLVERNTWGDDFWGVYQGQGHNHLGLLLMQHRAELRAPGTPRDPAPAYPLWLQRVLTAATITRPMPEAKAFAALVALAYAQVPLRGIFDPGSRDEPEPELSTTIDEIARTHLGLGAAITSWRDTLTDANLTFERKDAVEEAALHVQEISDTARFYAGLACGLVFRAFQK